MSEEQKEKWYKAFTREQLIERCEYLQRSCERKENSIMELEMDIADLEKGYCELKEKCNKGECDCTHEEYNNMCEENIKMDLEIERLHSIIKEVREYIKENTISYYTNLEHTNEEFELIGDPKELLEILDKENNNEDN